VSTRSECHLRGSGRPMVYSSVLTLKTQSEKLSVFPTIVEQTGNACLDGCVQRRRKSRCAICKGFLLAVLTC